MNAVHDACFFYGSLFFDNRICTYIHFESEVV